MEGAEEWNSWEPIGTKKNGRRRRRLPVLRRGGGRGRGLAAKESQNSWPNLSQTIGTLSLIRALSAIVEVKVSDLAQLNMSQLKAIGNKGRADDGDAGIRRGSRSFRERMPLSSKL